MGADHEVVGSRRMVRRSPETVLRQVGVSVVTWRRGCLLIVSAGLVLKAPEAFFLAVAAIVPALAPSGSSRPTGEVVDLDR
jgi:hypothetical protein